MKRRGYKSLFLFIFLFALGCSTVPTSGNAMLPEGIGLAQIPDVESSGYLYFNSDEPITLASDFFPQGDDPQVLPMKNVMLDKAAIVLGASASDFGGTLDFVTPEDASDAWGHFEGQVVAHESWGTLSSPLMHLATGKDTWKDNVKASYETEKLVSIKEHNPSAWDLLSNLPSNPPSEPIAAGALKLDEVLIASITERAALEMDGIGNAFGLVRVDSLGFAIYANAPLEVSSNIDRDYILNTGASLLFVSQSSYPAPLVAYMLSVMAERTEMELITLGNTNARYRDIEGLHLVIKNKGSLLYAAVAGTRADSENLILSALQP